jgi:hypothetical protein
MHATELRNINGGFRLACHIYDKHLELNTLSELTTGELCTLLARTARQDVEDKILEILYDRDISSAIGAD